MTPADVLAYRDHLRTKKRRRANTVATKLAIVRSFFEYLKAGGITNHKDPKTIMRYDHARENLDNSPVNIFYEDE